MAAVTDISQNEQDITSEFEIGSAIAPRNILWWVRFNLTQLTGVAETFTMKLYMGSAMDDNLIASEVVAKPVDGDTVFFHNMATPVYLAQGQELVATVSSTGADTTVTVAVAYIDPYTDVIVSGAVGATVTSDKVFTLDAGDTIDDMHNGHIITVTDAGGVGGVRSASRIIIDYVQSTKTVTLDEDLPFTPATGDGFLIRPDTARGLLKYWGAQDVSGQVSGGGYPQVDTVSVGNATPLTQEQVAPQLLHSTTIATLTTQDVFTLTTGSADDNSYRYATVRVTDSATGTQKAAGWVSSYEGTSPARQVTLKNNPGIFTMAVGDTVDLIASDAATITLLQEVAALIESQRGEHTAQGSIFYVSPGDGNTHANGNRGGRGDPYATIQDCHDNAVVAFRHDLIILLADDADSVTTETITSAIALSKAYVFIRGPGRDYIVNRSNNGDAFDITANGVELSGFQINTTSNPNSNGIQITDADFVDVRNVWINDTGGDGINILRGSNCQIHNNQFEDSGIGGPSSGLCINGLDGAADHNHVCDNHFHNCSNDAIKIFQGTTIDTTIKNNIIEGSGGYGINLTNSSVNTVIADNRFGNNSSGDILDGGTATIQLNNEQWATTSPTAAAIADAVLEEVVTDHSAVTSSLAEYVKFLRDTLEADVTIDTSDSAQYQIVGKIKGTSTELFRKDLKKLDGTPWNAATAMIGQHVEP